MVHNRYQSPGGEDESFSQETLQLRRAGAEVHTLEVSNDDIHGTRKLLAAAGATWSWKSYRQIHAATRAVRADIVHIQNFFPQVSPAAIYAARRAGAATVLSLRNYRLTCANAFLLRDGRTCEDCIGRRIGLPGIRHRCYRNSIAGSAAVVTMNATHHLLGTWSHQVDAFICLTEFAAQKMSEGPVPAARTIVKPNFLYPDPGRGSHAGDFALFVGRLSEEKGVGHLVELWQDRLRDVPLVVVGDGPMADSVSALADANELVTWLGYQPRDVTLRLMRDARCLLFPSVWYEGMPRTIIEAFACGLPVVAWNIGGMSEMLNAVDERLTQPLGDAAAFSESLRWLLGCPEGEHTQIADAVRREYELKYTDVVCLERLRLAYGVALRRRDGRTVGPTA
jgi:glycosyltransferase involved in cell wall biosynthesis